MAPCRVARAVPAPPPPVAVVHAHAVRLHGAVLPVLLAPPVGVNFLSRRVPVPLAPPVLVHAVVVPVPRRSGQNLLGHWTTDWNGEP